MTCVPTKRDTRLQHSYLFGLSEATLCRAVGVSSAMGAMADGHGLEVEVGLVPPFGG